MLSVQKCPSPLKAWQVHAEWAETPSDDIAEAWQISEMSLSAKHQLWFSR